MDNVSSATREESEDVRNRTLRLLIVTKNISNHNNHQILLYISSHFFSHTNSSEQKYNSLIACTDGILPSLSFRNICLTYQSFSSFSRSRFRTALRLAVLTFHISFCLSQSGTRDINQFYEKKRKFTLGTPLLHWRNINTHSSFYISFVIRQKFSRSLKVSRERLRPIYS